jgi:asparagine synthase (glutamine-hydrolysing)
MCGIAGAAGHGADREFVQKQLDCLGHRGPDASGIFARGKGAIGQTRLAVIDLVTGDPPITDEEATIAVVLNGEIYNYQSLRSELRAAGHTLATTTDTEVIAHLAEDLEPVELVRRLDGMFAIAVWDVRRQRLILARDRVGKKPLYYWQGSGTTVFGSEIKAVLAHPLVPRSLDTSAIPAYLTFGYVPTPRTFFEGILSVPPGHIMVVEADGSFLVQEYWCAPIPGVDGVAPIDLPLRDAAQEVRSLLEAAVRRRLVADVPVGAFLSGGVDSSAIVGVMATVNSGPVRTFTIGFEDDEGFDERPYARLVAERFATDHVELVVKPDAVDLVERLVWHHDEPFGDSSAVPTYLLSQLTRDHVTVALCGDGGDELFAGYERFPAAVMLDRYKHLPSPLKTAIASALGTLPPASFRGQARRLQKVAAAAERPTEDVFMSWVSYLSGEWRDALGAAASWPADDFHAKWARSRGAEISARLLDVTLRTYLLDDLLRKIDRMSMAHALEVRSPLLDRELLEFAVRLPRSARMRVWQRKRVLKAAVEDLVPSAILTRPKRGFAVPLERWFRSDLRDYLRGHLGSPSSRVRQHLRPDALDQILDEHLTGKANHREALWSLLTLEVFLRSQGW